MTWAGVPYDDRLGRGTKVPAQSPSTNEAYRGCRRLALVVVTVLLAGCYSNLPLGEPQAGLFDKRLLGRWLLSAEDASEATVLVVARFDDKAYVVSPENDFNDKDAMRVFVSEVNDDRFLNGQELNAELSERVFMFARYSFDDRDTVRLDVPALDALPHEVETSTRLVQHIVEHGDGPDFYTDKPMILRRLPSK